MAISRTLCIALLVSASCDSSSGEPGDGEPRVADAFCGSRLRIRKLDRLNEGAANLEIEREQVQTCWLFFEHDDGRLELFERLPSTVAGLPDGYCRVFGKKISNFQAESTGGDCLFYEETPAGIGQQRLYVVPEGEIQIGSADAVSMSLDMTGSLLVGVPPDHLMPTRAALFYDGRRDETPRVDPGSMTSGLAADVAECALGGCWTGTLAVVSEAGCANPDAPEGVRTFTVSDDRRAITPIDGDPIAAAPDADRCAAVMNVGSLLAGQWRITFALDGDKARVTWRYENELDSCERVVEGTWSRCP